MLLFCVVSAVFQVSAATFTFVFRNKRFTPESNLITVLF